MSPLADQHVAQRTVAEAIEHHLALQILRAELPAGGRLPSVRALADRWRTTAPTIQRVIDRLQAMDLVDVRPKSGVTVRDPERNGGLGLYPLWFEALADDPDACAKRLADFLDVRRVVLVHLLTRHHRRLLDAAPALQRHVAHLVQLDGDIGARADADMALSAAMIAVIDNSAVTAVLQTIGHLVWRVPWIAEAFYADAGAHRRMVLAMAAALGGPAGDLAARLLPVLERWDADVVGRFRAFMRGGAARV